MSYSRLIQDNTFSSIDQSEATSFALSNSSNFESEVDPESLLSPDSGDEFNDFCVFRDHELPPSSFLNIESDAYHECSSSNSNPDFNILDRITDYDSDTESTASLNPSIHDLHTPVLPMKAIYEDVKTEIPQTSRSISPSLHSAEPSFSPHTKRALKIPSSTVTSRYGSSSESGNLLSPVSTLAGSLSDLTLDEGECSSSLKYRDQTDPYADTWIDLLNISKETVNARRWAGDTTTESDNNSKWKNDPLVLGNTNSDEAKVKLGKEEKDEELLKPVITDCIKEELRCKIQLNRLQSGKGELKVDFEEPKIFSKMSLEEIRQRNITKQKNRIHAKVSRQRARDQRRYEEMRFLELLASKEKLVRHNRRLQKQVSRLKNALEMHVKSESCKLKS